MRPKAGGDWHEELEEESAGDKLKHEVLSKILFQTPSSGLRGGVMGLGGFFQRRAF